MNIPVTTLETDHIIYLQEIDEIVHVETALHLPSYTYAEFQDANDYFSIYYDATDNLINSILLGKL